MMGTVSRGTLRRGRSEIRWFGRLLALSAAGALAWAAAATAPAGAAATASASLTVPPTTLIGSDYQFDVAFANTGSTTGYGPYVDLFVAAVRARGWSTTVGVGLAIDPVGTAGNGPSVVTGVPR